MKICVKKVYCPTCRKLVKGYEEEVNGNIRVLCSKCRRLLSIWNGVTWKYV